MPSLVGGILGRWSVPNPGHFRWVLRYGVAVTSIFALLLPLGSASGYFAPGVPALLVACVVGAALFHALFVWGFALGPTVSVPMIFAGMITTLLFFTTAIHLTGGVASPLILVLGVIAAAVGINRRIRESTTICMAVVGFVATLAVLEYRGILPHVPVFADGSDPGLHNHPGYILVLCLLLAGQLLSIAFGTETLSRRLFAYETEATRREQKRWSALGQFATIVAHEVKNPLTGIQGAARLLERDADAASIQHRARVIGEAAGRLDGLVHQYLGFARPRPLRRRRASLNDVVRRAAVQVREIQHTGTELGLDLAADLPMAEIDPDQVAEAVGHLLRNAVDASPAGGRVRLSTSSEASDVVVRVADSGSGVLPDVYSQVFEPFFSTRAGHAGLGLAIVQRIAGEHGGSLSIENCLDGGAVAALRLPKEAE